MKQINQYTGKQVYNDFREAVASGEVQALIDAGWYMREISEKYGVSDSFVRQFSDVLKFKAGNDLHKMERGNFATWSEAKWLAMTSDWGLTL